MTPALQQSLMPWLRRLAGYLIKGFLVLLPLLGTLAIAKWIGGNFESFLGGPLQSLLSWLKIPRVHYIPGMGTVLLLAIIFLVGIFFNAWIVRTILGWFEQFFDRIPLIKSIYGSFRDLIGFFSSKQGKRITQVVMVRLGPAPATPGASGASGGVEVLGMLTREDFSDLPRGFGAGDTVAVYVPLSYALGGFTVMVPRDHVRPINMTMEEAMRFAVTAGMAVRPAEERAKAEPRAEGLGPKV